MGAVHRLLANGVLDIEPEIEYPAFEERWYKFKSKMLFEAICLHDLRMVKLLLGAGASTAECQIDASTELLEMGKLLKQHGARCERPNRGGTRGGLRPYSGKLRVRQGCSQVSALIKQYVRAFRYRFVRAVFVYPPSLANHPLVTGNVVCLSSSGFSVLNPVRWRPSNATISPPNAMKTYQRL
ncbi:hypothetical protein FN846DRAFT_892435 [Sphaerosporella brunnea]|uniref:Uncharacterized protein n=1 Tax=Sphaerosporella brunnea TaxID=1250544 RepID=A0A5J5EQA1_9PEZI|nr:hypothetical protein FN846DRAFT_892435 [Sphaerosporella brunnea]